MTIDDYLTLSTSAQLHWLRRHKYLRQWHVSFVMQTFVTGVHRDGRLITTTLPEAQQIPNISWFDDLSGLPMFDVEIDHTNDVADLFRNHLQELGLPVNAHFAITINTITKQWTLYSNLVHDELADFGSVEIMTKPYQMKPGYVQPYATHN